MGSGTLALNPTKASLKGTVSSLCWVSFRVPCQFGAGLTCKS